LINGEASGHQRILPNVQTLINVVRHLRHFGRFEMNKLDVDRQLEDRILVSEKEVENHLVGRYVLPRRLNVRIDGYL
jgi:hypothetical protein